MASMIKFELKKIFQSKIFIAVFFLALIGIISFTAFSLNQYRTDVRGDYRLPQDVQDVQDKKICETFVSSGNIDSMRAKLTAFEENDAIYENHKTWRTKHPHGGAFYCGKYEGTMTPTYEPPVIKDEYLPEYFESFYAVDKYDHKAASIERSLEYAQQIDKNTKMYHVFMADVQECEKALKEGFTVGYDYGWANIFDTFSSQIGILLAVVIVFGLCGVFTGEYANAADSLLLSSKHGRAKLVGAKIAASLLYTTLCWAVYIAMTVALSFAFLGTEGANVGDTISNIERLPGVCLRILLGALLLTLITLAVSAAFSKQLPSVAAAVLVGLLPAIKDIIYLDSLWGQVVDALPVNMIFSSYSGIARYVFYNNTLYDFKILFLPVAAVTVIVCLPLIYTFYCRHQVKN